VPKTKNSGILKLPGSSKEKEMRKPITFLAFVALGVSVVSADQNPTPGKIISETSVACGTKQQNKKQSTSLLCQQYTIHTSTTEYMIRQQKPSEKDILPANTPIEFTLSKDKMKFKVNGKKYEFLVVGTSALGAEIR
jgi:hypothetical protein